MKDSGLFRNEIEQYPYPHIISSLSEGDYRQLSENLPNWQWVAGDKSVKNNVRADRSALDLLDNRDVSPVWKEFASYYSSNEFYRQWLDKFEESVLSYYPWLEWAFRKKLKNLITARRGEKIVGDIYMNCQLSLNTPVREMSRVIGPHLDNPTELYGSLLYMRQPEDRSSGGGLTINVVKKPQIAGKREVVNSSPYITIPYDSNVYVGFLNTPYSVHGVTEREQTEKPRWMVNITIEMGNRALFNPEIYRL